MEKMEQQNLIIENHELEKQLTDEAIEEIIKATESAIMPHYETIEKLRVENPDREVGGRIVDGHLELFDESRWEKDSVLGDSYEEERKLSKEGVLSFHTHPENGLTGESAQDILAAYYRLKEVFFHKNGVTLLVALKELPIDEIRKIDKKAWQEAQTDEEEWGDPAYWFWKGKLKENLPIRAVELVGKN